MNIDKPMNDRPIPPLAGTPAGKWFNLPVKKYTGSLDEILARIPSIDRRPFAVTLARQQTPSVNPRLDLIVRLPFEDDKKLVPLGVVSKDYAFIEHQVLLGHTIDALYENDINPVDIEAELKLTEYGERMALSLFLPPKYDYTVGEKDSMSLRLELLNSVDGSTRFRVLMGWFRLVCTNGLVIGVTHAEFRRRHTGDLHVEDIAKVLADGIQDSESEKANLDTWRRSTFQTDKFRYWIKTDLRKTWGFKAATRAYHIANTGKDVHLDGPFKGNDPTTIPTSPTDLVRGSPQKSNTVFDLSQILSWLAKERNDLQEQIEWREQIPELLAPLT
jgi:hypothetical protein